MNSISEEQGFITRFINIIKKNYKLYSIFFLLILILFIFYQYYIYNKYNHILKTSILYNNIQSEEIKTEDIKSEIYINLNNLSKEKNFYGVLSTLEISKKNLELNNIEDAYNNYISLLNNKNLKNYYKGAIAIHGSYSLINKINLNLNNSNIVDKINNLLSYVDSSLNSYEGFKFEILYLILTFKQDINDAMKNNDEINKLYNQIQDNVNISSVIKARIKKIHEFQKYN